MESLSKLMEEFDRMKRELNTKNSLLDDNKVDIERLEVKLKVGQHGSSDQLFHSVAHLPNSTPLFTFESPPLSSIHPLSAGLSRLNTSLCFLRVRVNPSLHAGFSIYFSPIIFSLCCILSSNSHDGVE